MHHLFTLASLALASIASAENILITVGENSTTTFTPSNITANVGDTVIFQFVAANHTATQSSFAAPCTNMTGGLDSGFQFVPAGATQNPQYSFNVTNATQPLWFFCRQTGHCGKGMVFSVNAPATGKTFDAFQAAAKATAADANTSASAASSTASNTDTTGGSSTASNTDTTGGSSPASNTDTTGASSTDTSSTSTSGASTSSSTNPSGAFITRASTGLLAVTAGAIVGLLL
ncbi:hypothetical protein C8R45DRAFT_1097161 [Mycena sanguinolenta]|nr:hypothetical protein C8R45DRAFT_1097161 [Mycena sanguinolenta]